MVNNLSLEKIINFNEQEFKETPVQLIVDFLNDLDMDDKDSYLLTLPMRKLKFHWKTKQGKYIMKELTTPIGSLFIHHITSTYGVDDGNIVFSTSPEKPKGMTAIRYI